MKVIDGLVLLGAAGGLALTHGVGGWQMLGGAFAGAVALPVAVGFIDECTRRR